MPAAPAAQCEPAPNAFAPRPKWLSCDHISAIEKISSRSKWKVSLSCADVHQLDTAIGTYIDMTRYARLSEREITSAPETGLLNHHLNEAVRAHRLAKELAECLAGFGASREGAERFLGYDGIVAQEHIAALCGAIRMIEAAGKRRTQELDAARPRMKLGGAIKEQRALPLMRLATDALLVAARCGLTISVGNEVETRPFGQMLCAIQRAIPDAYRPKSPTAILRQAAKATPELRQTLNALVAFKRGRVNTE